MRRHAPSELTDQLAPICASLALAWLTGIGLAEADDTPTGESPPRTEARGPEPDSGWGVTGFPILFYSPETKTAAGGGVVLYDNHPHLRPDVTEFELFGTQMMQLELNLEHTTFFRGNDYQVNGELSLARSPSTAFFGVGADTPDSAREEYLRQRCLLDAAFLARVWGQLYLGPALDVSLFRATDLTEGGQLAANRLVGGRENVAVGGGLALSWDTTDSTFFPTSGYRLDSSALVFRQEVGGEHNFFQIKLDLRKYYAPTAGHVLAMQASGTFTRGHVPWQKLPELGGMFTLRGYYEGRYRDRHFVVAQVEYRFPIFWRFGGAAFASTGEVAKTVRGLSLDTLRASGGGGLRFLLDSDEHINLRGDVAVTVQGDSEFYISLLEAF